MLQSLKNIFPAGVKKRLGKLQLFTGAAGAGFFKWVFLNGENKYAYFQKKTYDHLAAQSQYGQDSIVDHVVGTYELQDTWQDYDTYLFKYVDESFKDKLALDFGTGPGRNIVKYHNRFKRLDGVDISKVNIENAKKNLSNHEVSIPQLFVNNGIDLKEIASNMYDFIFSTITMQHICVHEIRYSLLSEFFRTLKPSGRISIQMGYGTDGKNSVPYYANDYSALETNGQRDTQIESPDQIREDLEKIGFREFEYWIGPSGPKSSNKEWIYFTAVKPL